MPATISKGIFYVGQSAFDLFMLHLDVRKRSVAARTPVDKPVVPVDEPLFIEADKDLDDRPGESFIQREPLPGPVARSAKTLQLVDDPAAVFSLPFPDPSR